MSEEISYKDWKLVEATRKLTREQLLELFPKKVERMIDVAPGESGMIHASIIERNLWAEYEARQKMSSFERGFQIACGVLLALILGFDVWLVWLIWW